MSTTTPTIFHPPHRGPLATIVGPVLVPGDEGYAEETATWNLALTHRPAVAVGATSVADVRAAVRFAAANDLPVAVVATGHGAMVPADGAVLINVRRLNGVVIDHERRTATVGAAVELQSVIEAAAAVGLAPLAGSSPNVGVVGFTLGGGLSPVLGRAHGYAADHVLSAELVTADGELHRVDPDHEPELFWAIRGGKGNFGVVTSLTIGLVPVTRFYGGGLFYPGEYAGVVLDTFRRLAATAPDELSLSVALLRMPPLPFVPEPLRGRFVAHARVAYLGSAAVGAELVAELRGAAPLLADSVAETPYREATSLHAEPVDPLPGYEAAAQLTGFPPEAVDAVLAVAGPDVDTPVLMVEVRQLGGALGRPPRLPNAVGNRHARFQVFAGTAGEPGMADTFRPVLQGVVEMLKPWQTGTRQVNFLGPYDAAPDAVATAYEPADHRRLRRVKAAYDPRNLFRINHNIVPDHGSEPAS